MGQMRTIEIEGKTFKWKAGRRFLRIQGNGHSADIEFAKFLAEEKVEVRHPYDAELESYYSDRDRFFSITPRDVRDYVVKHGWVA